MMGVISGIATTPDGKVWVSDATSNSLLLFQPPE
jgi:streptogramin lyase